ncbi:MAG: hypothetical protein IAE97_02735 [Chthoniobacterales bacterium]|nr:hypothetical protein [Chthoniobacterales bacterium]
MKTLLIILVLGGIAFYWHRDRIDKLSSELQTARTELKQAQDELAANSESLQLAQNEVRKASAMAHANDGSLQTLTTEAENLRLERDALRSELDALKAPKVVVAAPPFDSSPMASFAYDGTRFIEARITEISPAGVTVAGKDGRTVVVELDKAIKIPELRIRARDAIQAASAGQ